VSRVSQIEPLPSAHLRLIERVPGVRRATLVGALPAIYQSRGNDVLALATDPGALFDIYPDWSVSPGELQAMSGKRTGALVGAALMKAYGWRLGDRIPLRTSVVQQDGSTDWSFEIVGTYSVTGAATQENRIIVNYAYFDEARMFDRGRAFAFIASIDDPLQSTRICAAIDALFANSPDETLTQNEAEFAQSQLRQLGDVGLMVNAIVGAVLFTLLFLTGNTMRQAVRERIPEFAVLKAIGFSDGMVTVLVLAESMCSRGRCIARLAARPRSSRSRRRLGSAAGVASRRRERRNRARARAREWLAAGMACTPAFDSRCPGRSLRCGICSPEGDRRCDPPEPQVPADAAAPVGHRSRDRGRVGVASICWWRACRR
jgi:hypothetical protein